MNPDYDGITPPETLHVHRVAAEARAKNDAESKSSRRKKRRRRRSRHGEDEYNVPVDHPKLDLQA